MKSRIQQLEQERKNEQRFLHLPNYAFYKNKKRLPAPLSCTIDEFHRRCLTRRRGGGGADDDVYIMLEREHSYIQWLFPLLEKSSSVKTPHFPFSPEEIILFSPPSSKNNNNNNQSEGGGDIEICQKFNLSLQIMLDFFGFESKHSMKNQDIVAIVPSRNFIVRARSWMSHPHNDKRITRILKCLSLLKMYDIVVAFLDALASQILISASAGSPGILFEVQNSFLNYWLPICDFDDTARRYLHAKATTGGISITRDNSSINSSSSSSSSSVGGGGGAAAITLPSPPQELHQQQYRQQHQQQQTNHEEENDKLTIRCLGCAALLTTSKNNNNNEEDDDQILCDACYSKEQQQQQQPKQAQHPAIISNSNSSVVPAIAQPSLPLPPPETRQDQQDQQPQPVHQSKSQSHQEQQQQQTLKEQQEENNKNAAPADNIIICQHCNKNPALTSSSSSSSSSSQRQNNNNNNSTNNNICNECSLSLQVVYQSLIENWSQGINNNLLRFSERKKEPFAELSNDYEIPIFIDDVDENIIEAPARAAGITNNHNNNTQLNPSGFAPGLFAYAPERSNTTGGGGGAGAGSTGARDNNNRKNLTFPSITHAYEAMKYIHTDYETASFFFSSNNTLLSARDAIEFSITQKTKERSDFLLRREEILLKLLRLKFSSEHCRRVLETTGSSELVYVPSQQNDNFLGCGRTDAGGGMSGSNTLGVLLMRIRRENNKVQNIQIQKQQQQNYYRGSSGGGGASIGNQQHDGSQQQQRRHSNNQHDLLVPAPTRVSNVVGGAKQQHQPSSMNNNNSNNNALKPKPKFQF